MCDLLIGGQLEDLLEGVGQDAGRFDAFRRFAQHVAPPPLLVALHGEARPVPQTSCSCFLLLSGCDALGPLELCSPGRVEDGVRRPGLGGV